MLYYCNYRRIHSIEYIVPCTNIITPRAAVHVKISAWYDADIKVHVWQTACWNTSLNVRLDCTDDRAYVTYAFSMQVFLSRCVQAECCISNILMRFSKGDGAWALYKSLFATGWCGLHMAMKLQLGDALGAWRLAIVSKPCVNATMLQPFCEKVACSIVELYLMSCQSPRLVQCWSRQMTPEQPQWIPAKAHPDLESGWGWSGMRQRSAWMGYLTPVAA